MDIFSPAAPLERLPDDAPRLLVVDESRTALQVMGKRLTRMGYRVSLSDNGFEALDLLAGRRFDLLLVDMAMAALPGLAVLREVRASPTCAATPVLMMTDRADNGAAVDALAAGADDCVVKPFAFEVLGARIARLLDRARAFDALRRSNEALDARIAHRAIELGELRQELACLRAELMRVSGASATA